MIARAVRRHPLASFLLWTYLVGQPIVLVPVIARDRGVELPTQPFIIVTTLVAVLLPALVVTRITEGPAAVHRMLASAIGTRIGLRWYLLALVVVPLLATALAVAFHGLPDVDAGTVWSSLVVGLLVQTLLGLLFTNLWEEIGWMGFVQSRLRARHGALLAAVLTAPLFMLQHVTLLIDSLDVGAVVVLVLATVVMVPFRLVLGWVHDRTDSLFAVGLVHAAGNAAAVGSGVGLGMLEGLYPGRDVGSMHVLAFVLLGLAVAVLARGRLGRPAPAPSVPAAALQPAGPGPA